METFYCLAIYFRSQENSNQFPNSVCPYSSVIMSGWQYIFIFIHVRLTSNSLNFLKLQFVNLQLLVVFCNTSFFDVTSVSSYIFFIFVLQKQPPEVFRKGGAPETFVKLTVKHLCGSMRLQTSGLNLHTSGLQPYQNRDSNTVVFL